MTKQTNGAAHPSPEWPTFQETKASTLCEHFFIDFEALRKSVTPNPAKKPIVLGAGDPTLVPGGPRCIYATEALIKAAKTQKYEGYHLWWGGDEARQAVADHCSTNITKYSPDDVIITIGGGHGLELMVTGLAEPGDNILFPGACYRVYETYTKAYEVEFRGYKLDVENGLMDLEDLENQIDGKTKAIVVNNPHNPLGAVYPREHLEKVLRLAEKYRLPILADEIYGCLVFGEEKFYRLTDLEPKVPIITLDALSKSYLVPGWRCGWLLLRDHQHSLSKVWQGMRMLCLKALGVSSVLEGALPDILKNTPQKYFDDLNDRLGKNARLFYDLLSKVPGLKPVLSKAAIYLCVKIDRGVLGEEIDFLKGLIKEEAVTTMPGSFMGLPGYFRVILLMPEEAIIDACSRIHDYCVRKIEKSQEIWPIFEETHHASLCDHYWTRYDALRKSIQPNLSKSPIVLSMGDPSLIPGAPRCDYVAEALSKAVKSRKHDGYPSWGGNLETRQALADHYSNEITRYTADEVIVTIGGEHAFELMISGLANPGENILLPLAYYPVYKTFTEAYEVEFRAYNLLLPNGLIDLEDLEKKIDKKTKAIFINNPHNPLGTIYPKGHLEKILIIANKHHLPLLVDEIYASAVYGKTDFHRIVDLEPRVPCITLDSMSKKYLVPGYRCGWLLLRDHQTSLSNVWKGIKKMSYKTLGVTSVIQAALPDILQNTPKIYFDDLNDRLKKNADLFYSLLKEIEGLDPILPEAAFYMCTKIDEELLGDEISFLSGLIQEEAVTLMPASFMGLPGYFRVVLLMPEEKIIECCERIAAYCQRIIIKTRKIKI